MQDDKILITINRKLFVKLLRYAQLHELEFQNKSAGVVNIIKYITKDIEVITNSNYKEEMLQFGFVPKEDRGKLILPKNSIKSPEQARESVRDITHKLLKKGVNHD